MSEIVEFRVKLNGIKDGKDTNDNLLFKDIYDKGKNILEDIIKNQKKNKNNLQNNNSVSNIIAFCGDRGTGKTSAINEFSERYMLEQVEVVPTIDPTLLSSNDSVLEIVIAKLFEGFDVEKITDPEKQRKVLGKFEEIYNQLSTLHQEKKERFSKDFNGGNLELISRLQSSLDITNTLKDIIELYLEDKDKKTHILIKIDDVDMNLKNAYPMIEEIRKYLNVNNLIILVAFNDIQMGRLLSQQFKNELGEYKANILASNYLTKLFPPQNRLYMPKLDKLILSDEATFVGYDEKGNEVENEPIVDTILGEIFNKTRLIFLKNKYGFNTLIPTNLRELSQLRLFLHNLEIVKDDVNTIDDIYNDNLNKKIRKNLILFRDYFLYERINSDLTYNELEFLRMLPNLQAGKVNKEIHLYFTKKAKGLGIPLNILKNEDEDVETLNMAKIITEINIVRENDKGTNDQFVYYVKCVYSMIILENTLIAISDNKSNNLLGNIGKYIIGSYKYEDKDEDEDKDDNLNKKRNFEYEFYPTKDANSEYIKNRKLGVVDFKLLDSNSNSLDTKELVSFDCILNRIDNYFDEIRDNLTILFGGKDIRVFVNYIFSLYISYGNFNGDEFIKSAKTHRGDIGKFSVHFRINNLIYHLLDIKTSISRNFDDIEEAIIYNILGTYDANEYIIKQVEDGLFWDRKDEIFDIFKNPNIADKVKLKKIKELIGKITNDYEDPQCEAFRVFNVLEFFLNLKIKIENQIQPLFNNNNKNVCLLFPIYSIDYIEKINSFNFSYKSGVDGKFYRLMFDNFFTQLNKCNNKIIDNNQFLNNTGLNSLREEFTKGLKSKETKDLLKLLIENFLTTENKKSTTETTTIMEELNQENFNVSKIPTIPTKATIEAYLAVGSTTQLEELCENFKIINAFLENLKNTGNYNNIDINKLIGDLNYDMEIYKKIIKDRSLKNINLDNRKIKQGLKGKLDKIYNGTN